MKTIKRQREFSSNRFGAHLMDFTFILKTSRNRNADAHILQRQIKCVAYDTLGPKVFIGQHGLIDEVVQRRQMEPVNTPRICIFIIDLHPC